MLESTFDIGSNTANSGMVTYAELGYDSIDGVVCMPGTVISKSHPLHKGRPAPKRVCGEQEPAVGYRCTCWKSHKHVDHVAHDDVGNVLAIWIDNPLKGEEVPK